MAGDDESVMAPVSRGVWCLTADLDLLGRLGASDFDWMALDAQHGALDRAALHAAGRVLSGARVPFVVRVPSVDPAWIGLALDAGALAVVVPSVTTVADAVIAAQACRYPPLGERSWGQLAPLWGGLVVPPEEANAAVRCAVMIETSGALEDVEAIASTPGVDLLFIGPLDLSLSLGTTVDALLEDHGADSPLRRVVAAAGASSIGVGAFAGSADVATRMRAHGIRCLAVTTDLAIVDAGVAAALTAD
ncbi:MAG: aldolase/citrate lyase family protein [Ornithinibacter sp.]